MKLKEPILCLCNYGQVRSVTMSKILEERGYQSLFAGMINTHPNFLNKIIESVETVIVCNKPNVERKFDTDTSQDHAKMILSVLETHKDKILTCDTVGFDRWGVPMHPDLVEKCKLFLDNL